VVPRALPVTSPGSTIPYPRIGQWQPVTLLDGRTTVQVCYQGELPSSAALLRQGRRFHLRRVVDRQYELDLDDSSLNKTHRSCIKANR
jgi:hypothetical protein